MTVEFQLPEKRGVVWTPSAVTSLIGQQSTFEGWPAQVTQARMDRRGRVFVTVKLDPK